MLAAALRQVAPMRSGTEAVTKWRRTSQPLGRAGSILAIHDARPAVEPVDLAFHGRLTDRQQQAVDDRERRGAGGRRRRSRP